MLAIFYLNATISSGNALGLLIQIGVVIVDFWAVSRIIGQAGYSRSWILVPLMPLVLTIIAFFIVFHDLSSGFFGGSFGVSTIDTIGAIWVLDIFSLVVNWIFFLIFAFSTWPVTRQNYAHYARPTPPTTGSGPVRSYAPPPSPIAPLSGTPSSRPAPPSPSPSPSLPPPPSRPTIDPQGEIDEPEAGAMNQAPIVAPTVQYCQWCGKEQAINALAIHHCGPKTRPAAYCTNCGTPLTPGSSICTRCGVAYRDASPPAAE
jgi:hypothetical protein